MIKSFSINRFRGINFCEIQDIGKINIFLGKNNCGKSSILEALFLLTGGSIPYNYQKINLFRRFPLTKPADLRLNFYRLETSSPITLQAQIDNGKRQVDIRYQEKNVVSVNIDGPQLIAGDNPKDFGVYFNMQTEKGNHYLTSLEILHEEEDKFQLQQDETELISARYISPADPYESFEELFIDLVEKKQENQIVNIVQQIDPSIKDIVLAGHRVLVDIGQEKRIPIQLMGDGLRKVLSVIVNLLYAPSGIVLIDELDNGLHFSAMPLLWRAICLVAKTRDIQIFVTTHNIDSLQAAASVMSESDFVALQDGVSVYSLLKKDDHVTAIRSSYRQFDHVITQNLEIR